MAQTGYTPISIYYSATASNTPTAGNLVAGELAINTADGKLFYKDSAGVVQVIGTKGGVGSSSTTQVLYNSSGLVVGSANLTFNGTTLTTANDASISGLTVGKGGGAVSQNTAIGNGALGVSNTGLYNSAYGNLSLYLNTSGGANSAYGYTSLFVNTTGGGNSAFGAQALYSNTTGSSNTSIGNSALQNNTTASNNTAVGYQAGYTNTGAENTFVGYQAGYSNTSSARNVLVGFQTGYSVTSGVANVFMGGGQSGVDAAAGYFVTTGSNNTFLGWRAGTQCTTGSKNTILGGYTGNQGGLDIRTASNYIVLSDGDGNPRVVSDGSGNLLSGCVAQPSNTVNGFYVGNGGTGILQSAPSANANFVLYKPTSASQAAFQLFLTNNAVVGSITQNGTTGVLYNLTSDYRLKDNATPLTGASEFIMALKPKTWDWYDGSGKGVGFIAHEFMEVAKYSGNGTKDEIDADGKPVYQSIQPSSSEVMANLVALVQELKAEVDSLKQQLGK